MIAEDSEEWGEIYSNKENGGEMQTFRKMRDFKFSQRRS
jgi:hypothetical protein